MRIVVTGGSGFIGSHVVQAATGAGHDVRVVDLRATHPADALDVRDADAMVAALRGAEVVVHLAAKVGLERSFADAPEYVSHNDGGTAVVLASSMVCLRRRARQLRRARHRPAGAAPDRGSRGRPVRTAVPGLRGGARPGAGRPVLRGRRPLG